MKACIPKEQIEILKDKVLKGQVTPDDVAKMLPEEKTALKSILEDFVTEKMGIKVSSDEIANITKKAKVIDSIQKTLGDDLGNPAKFKENLDFFKAKREMDNYLLSRAPSHQLRVLTGTIGRGMMLFSIKSPVLNIGSNMEIGFAEAISRRLAGGVFKSTDTKLARDYMRMVNRIYQKSGYDISRMTSLSDAGSMGERVLGQVVHSQGKGAVRKVGRGIEDVVFKQMMGAPDVAFSSAHFADSVNLNSLKMAKGNKAEAIKMMTDSMRIDPVTLEGKLLRAQGIFDAQKATWTDTSWASRVSEGIRKIFNDVSGDLRAGDFLFPFIKTPANVISTGMDYAGMGIPKALIKTVQAIRSGELGSKEYFHSITRDLVRSGLGITGAVIVASQLKDDDFVGAYDPARSQIETLRNSNYNAIRIKGKWVSTDWLGPLAVPVTAMMYARKYGSTGGEKTFQYTKGVLASAMNIPGVSDIYDTVKSQAYKKNQSLEEMTGEAANYATSQLWSRLVPSFVSDISKAVDPNVRQGGKGLTGVQAKTPFLSQQLPIKKNIFGEDIKGESPLTDIFFGSRIKTDKESPLIKEINTVSESSGKGIAFTDWDKSSSKTLAQFKDKVGQQKFNEAKVRYGKRLKTELEKLIRSSQYRKANDDEKVNLIRNADTIAQDSILKQYRFKYKTEKKK